MHFHGFTNAPHQYPNVLLNLANAPSFEIFNGMEILHSSSDNDVFKKWYIFQYNFKDISRMFAINFFDLSINKLLNLTMEILRDTKLVSLIEK